jgi:hypothetical protein
MTTGLAATFAARTVAFKELLAVDEMPAHPFEVGHCPDAAAFGNPLSSLIAIFPLWSAYNSETIPVSCEYAWAGSGANVTPIAAKSEIAGRSLMVMAVHKRRLQWGLGEALSSNHCD